MKNVYPVYCPECDWVGMSDDCLWGRCPYCQATVKKEIKVKMEDNKCDAKS